MKKILLSQGKTTLVDDEDYDFLTQWKWCVGGSGYALRGTSINGKKKTVFMHREVNETAEGFDTDHINNDKLDNRSANLRHTTTSQNLMNATPMKGKSSRYKGVSFVKSHKKWSSRIQIKDKYVFLGYFDLEIEAAKKYNARASEVYGKFARLNVL